MTAENDSGMRWLVPLFPCSIFDLQMTAEPQKKFCKEVETMEQKYLQGIRVLIDLMEHANL